MTIYYIIYFTLIIFEKTSKEYDVAAELYIAYVQELNIIAEMFGHEHEKYVMFISFIDFYNSLATVAVKYKYTRPVLKNQSTSSFKCSAMRHPILEQINNKHPFIPNDFDTDKPTLLFGVNGCGKSILLKTVANLIIMAQIGCYVPAEYLELAPFTKIITRITYDDNMYKNQSSFMVEMTELRSILKHADEKSLVLGDEICKGTETNSAIAIVQTAISTLCKRGIKFIFTTHLHSLNTYLADLVNDGKLYMKHLSIHRNERNEIICDRKLYEGSGPSTYGIEVCRSVGFDNDFIASCMEIRRKLIGENTELLSTKKSNYNSMLFVDNCDQCGSQMNLETDHKMEQKLADENGFIKEPITGAIYHKNRLFNLQVLCKSCHNKKTFRLVKE